MTWRVHKTHHPEQFTVLSAVGAPGPRAVAYRCGAMRTLVKCCIGIADLDRNSSSKLFTVSAGPDSRDSLDKRCLAMVNMPGGADVNTWLVSIFVDIPFRQGLFPMQQVVS